MPLPAVLDPGDRSTRAGGAIAAIDEQGDTETSTGAARIVFGARLRPASDRPNGSS